MLKEKIWGKDQECLTLTREVIVVAVYRDIGINNLIREKIGIKMTLVNIENI